MLTSHQDTAAPSPPAPMAVVLLGWKPAPKGALLGFATVQIGQLTIRDVVILRQGDAPAWVAMPGKPRLDPAGTAQRDGKGKVLYNPVLEWGSKEAAARFSAGVLGALEGAHPGCTR